MLSMVYQELLSWHNSFTIQTNQVLSPVKTTHASVIYLPASATVKVLASPEEWVFIAFEFVCLCSTVCLSSLVIFFFFFLPTMLITSV